MRSPCTIAKHPAGVNVGVFLAAILGLLLPASAAQVSRKTPATDSTAAAHKGIQLASAGLCKEALPVLKKAIPHIAEKQVLYDAAMAQAQCGMSTDQEDAAVEALAMLRREFPADPRVLYTATHFYSELASRAAHELATVAPDSAQLQELNAEALESQGKWDEAEAAYRRILEKYPEQPGIHYRLGRIILSKPSAGGSADAAKKEFEAELKIDPNAASAEFMLGDLARQATQWDEAIAHFSRAAQLDAGFSEAFLGLGISFNATGKHSDAVAPLEKYVKMDPSDPAGHYQLAIAYARTGRTQDANREIALQHEAEKKAQHAASSDPGPQQ